MADNTGLEMNGVYEETAAFCRVTHNALLNKHGITHWPLTVTVAPMGPSSAQRYRVVIECGLPATRNEMTITDPDSELRNKLARILDDSYAKHGSL